jgi:hypothetical protein
MIYVHASIKQGDQATVVEPHHIRARPLGLLTTAALPFWGVLATVGSFYVPQAQPVRILFVAWTVLTLAGVVSTLLFALTITPTGLQWKYVRAHELNFEDIRDLRIVGARPGGILLVIRGQRGAENFRIPTVDLRRHDIQAIIAAVEQKAPHATIDERVRHMLRR